MGKIDNCKIGDVVNFVFLGEKHVGVVTECFGKEGKICVKCKNGTTYLVRENDKDSKFCYLI